jgi:hypothetical protein
MTCLLVPILTFGAAACGPAAAPDTPVPEASAPDPGDLLLVATMPNPARTLERIAGQYARVAEAVEGMPGVRIALPPAEAIAAPLRTLFRSQGIHGWLSVPPRFPADLSRAFHAAALVDADGPGMTADVPLLDDPASAPPPRAAPPPGVRLLPLPDRRLAVGYDGRAPVPLDAVASPRSGPDVDLALSLRPGPASARFRRWLLGLLSEERAREEISLVEEAVATLALAALDRLDDLSEVRGAVLVGDRPGDPALRLEMLVVPRPDGDLAPIAAPAPAGGFPFLGAVPGNAVAAYAARACPGDEAIRGVWIDLIGRLGLAVEQQAPPPLAAAAREGREAFVEGLRHTDGRSLLAWYPPEEGEESLLLGSITLIVGVRDADAVRPLVRRILASYAAVGSMLAPLACSCDIEFGFESAVEAAGGFEVDVLTARVRLTPYDLESGIRPRSVEVAALTGADRVVVVFGGNRAKRLAWALGEDAPGGGLAADPQFRLALDRAPADAVFAGVLEMIGIGHTLSETPPRAVPPIPITGWAAPGETGLRATLVMDVDALAGLACREFGIGDAPAAPEIPAEPWAPDGAPR